MEHLDTWSAPEVAREQLPRTGHATHGACTETPSPTLGQRRLDALLLRAPDHDDDIRRHVVGAQRCGVSIRCADRMSDGLDLLKKDRFDAVLLDLHPPVGGALEALETVLAEGPELPVVVLIGGDDADLGDLAMLRGAQEYLVAPELGAALLARTLRHAVENKRRQAALERHARELERRNRELGEFAACLAHDIKQPLSTLQLWCALLKKRSESDEHVAELIAHTRDAVMRMSGLVDALLGYASATGGAPTIGPADSSVALDAAIANLGAAIARSGAEIYRGELPVVDCDAKQLAQVFQNLLLDAINATPQGPPRIRVAAEETYAAWTFRVRGSRTTLEPREAAELFSERNLTRPDAIGRAICKRIVEAHGGRIWAPTGPDGSSAIVFSIPRAYASCERAQA